MRGVQMKNKLLIGKMLESCKKFEDEKLSISDLQSSLETYAPLLEKVERKVFQELHDSSNDLEFIQHARLLEEQYEATCKVIEKIRSTLCPLLANSIE